MTLSDLKLNRITGLSEEMNVGSTMIEARRPVKRQ